MRFDRFCLVFAALAVVAPACAVGDSDADFGEDDPDGTGGASDGGLDATPPRDSGVRDAGARDAGGRDGGATTDAGDGGANRDGGGSDGGPNPVARCGDNFIDKARGEVCDDGNNISGDGCSADCTSVECTLPDSYEDPVTHHCYWRRRASSDVRPRATGEARCIEQGGYLVRLGSAEERAAVLGPTLRNVGGVVWIGLKRQGGGWVWDDGSNNAAALKAGEPFGSGDCVEWHRDDRINARGCGDNRDFICEREPRGTPR